MDDRHAASRHHARHFFKQSGFGIGGVALSSLLDERLLAFTPRPTRRRSGARRRRRTSRRRRSRSSTCSWPARRRSSICSTTSRRCSKYDGQEIPEEFIPRASGSRSSRARRGCSARRSRSSSYGQSGAELSELLPHLATIADDIAIVRSMHTTQFNHAPGADLHEHRAPDHRAAEHRLVAHLRPRQREQGSARLRRPDLGPEQPRRRQVAAGAAASCRRSTRASSSGRRAIRSCSSSNPDGVDASARRESLDLRARPEPSRSSQQTGDPEIDDAHRGVRDGVPDADAACPS